MLFNGAKSFEYFAGANLVQRLSDLLTTVVGEEHGALELIADVQEQRILVLGSRLLENSPHT